MNIQIGVPSKSPQLYLFFGRKSKSIQSFKIRVKFKKFMRTLWVENKVSKKIEWKRDKKFSTFKKCGKDCPFNLKEHGKLEKITTLLKVQRKRKNVWR